VTINPRTITGLRRLVGPVLQQRGTRLLCARGDVVRDLGVEDYEVGNWRWGAYDEEGERILARTVYAAPEVFAALLDAEGTALEEPEPNNVEPEGDGPITTWRATAAAIGMSEDTLLRRRREHGAMEMEPYFCTAAAAVAWYEGLSAPKKPARSARSRASTRRAPGAAKAAEPVDWSILTRELTDGATP